MCVNESFKCFCARAVMGGGERGNRKRRERRGEFSEPKELLRAQPAFEERRERRERERGREAGRQGV